MSIHRDFPQALEAFRLNGGAMNYHQTSSTEPAAWEVDDANELSERITVSPKEATRRALSYGGMSPSEIDAELADWID